MADDASKPPPRRARFQVHLSTAIVLMFTAGALMWANVTPCKVIIWPFLAQYNGWPFTAIGDTIILPDAKNDSKQFIYIISGTSQFIIYWRLCLDIAIALLILSSVWYACEWLIRRRALKKGP
jgi:hypothetical protein